MDQPNRIPLHFRGKEALEHVIDARIKGRAASEELHGTELAGHYYAATDAAKETSLVLFLLWILLTELAISLDSIWWLSCGFILGWLIWKVSRSIILGYARLERLHRLIEEERWEIEHHRLQEREELKALYAAKGFTGKLLEESLDVLMADDNRLLQVMLEEELGLSLESYEHPLRQGVGACVGVLAAGFAMSVGFFLFFWWGAILSAILVIAIAAGKTAHFEKNKPLSAIIWNLANAALAASLVFFSMQFLTAR